MCILSVSLPKYAVFIFKKKNEKILLFYRHILSLFISTQKTIIPLFPLYGGAKIRLWPVISLPR
ncbi:hypothetical protein HanXRQr2_Chr13g0592491 [Helianthus annuus]|uniref:Uncharacterized protein n=1 Tax=Helianthus annuus TaxID=4232 RepID=A0A9K3EIE4_HELAN|nr:hypothetical protein HanXRQr2_Chr13g0592491 [Helianthus annuus]KAJ0481625.1 hypothetical protein HanIR_Chr13g0644671 [Helianthus annuus]